MNSNIAMERLNLLRDGIDILLRRESISDNDLREIYGYMDNSLGLGIIGQVWEGEVFKILNDCIERYIRERKSTLMIGMNMFSACDEVKWTGQENIKNIIYRDYLGSYRRLYPILMYICKDGREVYLILENISDKAFKNILIW